MLQSAMASGLNVFRIYFPGCSTRVSVSVGGAQVSIRAGQLEGPRYDDRIQRCRPFMKGWRVGQKREGNRPRQDFTDSELTTWDGVAGR